MSTWYSQVEGKKFITWKLSQGGIAWAGWYPDLTFSHLFSFELLSYEIHTQLRHQSSQKVLCNLFPWSLNLKFESLSDAWQLLLDRPEAWSVLRNRCPAQPHHLHKGVRGERGGLAVLDAPHTLWLDSCQAETGSDLAEPSQLPQDSWPCCTTKSKVINLYQRWIEPIKKF